MAKLLLLCFSGAIMLLGCDTLAPASPTARLRSEAPRPITLANSADRPLVGIASERELLVLIDPLPALRQEEFRKRALYVGATDTLDQISGYEPGDDVVVLLYAFPRETTRCGAVLTGSLLVTDKELRERDYRIVVQDLPPGKCPRTD